MSLVPPSALVSTFVLANFKNYSKAHFLKLNGL